MNNIFKKLTPTSAYWLGILAADGYLTLYKGKYKRVGLGMIDKEHIEKFANDIGYTNKISQYKYKTKNGTTRTIYSVTISDDEIYDTLIERGLCLRKSRKLKASIIPKKFTKHFIRGVFDGDGCISSSISKGHKYPVYKFSIVGHKPFLNGISKILGMPLSKPTKKKSTTYKIEKCAKDFLIKTYDYLYNNADRYLQRKKDKFDEAIKFLNKEHLRPRKYSNYINGVPYISTNCEQCGKPILRINYSQINTKKRFCNSKCHTQYKWKKGIIKGAKKKYKYYINGLGAIKVKCTYCQKEFLRDIYQAKRVKNIFCDNKCQAYHRYGPPVIS